MRRNLISLFLIGITISANAQQHKFIGGLLVNINGLEFNGNTAQFWNSSGSTTRIDGTLGFSAGLFVKREFSKNIYSTLEFRYINKGSIYEFISPYGTPASETLVLNYLELPVLIGYKIKPGKRTLFLESGLAFAKLISSNINAGDLINRTGTPNADAFKTTDISWIGSLKFPLVQKCEKNFLFGLRVSRSIPAIHKYYKIYNFDYGIEFDYVFNNN